MTKEKTAAIIGAGVGGMSCARILRSKGWTVKLFDKGRRPGGRLSTRTHRLGESEREQFDHGAQYFSARSEPFKKELQGWLKAGQAALWEGRFVRGSERASLEDEDLQRPRYVGAPAMDTVAYAMAEGLDITLETRISALKKGAEGTELVDESGQSHGCYETVILNMPPEQALALLESVPTAWRGLAEKAVMEPCWALMTVWEQPLPLDFDGARLEDQAMSWVGRNSSKPGRGEAESWVIHGSPSWTRDHLELSREDAGDLLLKEFQRWAGVDQSPLRARAHRWRYAQASEKAGPDFLYDEESGLGACGDWCHHGTVEGAWRSGYELGLQLTVG